MQMPRWFPVSLLAIGLSLLARSSEGHGLDAGHTTIELDGLVVRVVSTPRSASFLDLDEDGDGRFGVGEVRLHRAVLRERVDASFSLTDTRGASPTCDRTDVSTPGSGGVGAIAPSDHLRVARTCRFDSAPEGLVVGDRLAVDAPVVIDAFRVGQGDVERVALTSARTVTLLAPVPPAAAPPPSGGEPSPIAAVIALGVVGCVFGVTGVSARRSTKGTKENP